MSISVAFIGLVVAATSAYVFSRFLISRILDGSVAAANNANDSGRNDADPNLSYCSRYHLKDNILGLVVAYIATAVPFSIWMLKGYYDTIPYDLEEAAQVDGASPIGAFARVVIPVSTPALMTVFLWNSS